MKESYLTKACRKTVYERFPEREAVLNFAFEKRLSELRSEHAGASKERLRHLESQIIPGIAIYETLQTVMPKDEALNAVHGYVEERAYRLKKTFLRLMRIPGLYQKRYRVSSPSRRRKSLETRRALRQMKSGRPAVYGALI